MILQICLTHRRSNSWAFAVRMRRSAEREAFAVRMRGAACKQCAFEIVLIIALCVLSNELQITPHPGPVFYSRHAAQALLLIRSEWWVALSHGPRNRYRHLHAHKSGVWHASGCDASVCAVLSSSHTHTWHWGSSSSSAHCTPIYSRDSSHSSGQLTVDSVHEVQQSVCTHLTISVQCVWSVRQINDRHVHTLLRENSM